MATPNYWQGKLIRLRGVEEEDAVHFARWNEDSEAARLLDFLWPPGSLAGVKEWVAKLIKEEPKDDQFMFLMENLEGNTVGAISTHITDRRVGSFRYGFSVEADFRRCGYAREAVLLLLHYFFEELRYQKCTVTVNASNEASQRFHENFGFQLEGRLRRMIYTRGQFYDELYYGITAEEFAHLYGLRESDSLCTEH